MDEEEEEGFTTKLGLLGSKTETWFESNESFFFFFSKNQSS